MTEPPPHPSDAAGFGQSRFQLDPDDAPTVPKLFAQADLPAEFWAGPAPGDPAAPPPSSPPPSSPSPSSPPSSSAPPMASTPPPVVPAGPPAPPPPPAGPVAYGPPPTPAENRRRALIGVGLVALATVLVVLAALVIGPHLGSDDGDGDVNQQAAPPLTPASTSSVTDSSPPPGSGAVPPPVGPATSSPTGGSAADTIGTRAGNRTAGGAGPTGPRSVVTVTVTADPSGSDSGRRTATTTTRSAATRTTPSTTATRSTSTTTSSSRASDPYGVPIQQISCSDGYIVQLASELTPQAFRSRVAELTKQGMVPADAKAADSSKSCRLFTNQTNTLILYAGPFADRYDACAVRLAGPYDAFIRGANPGTSGDFVSCICPASVRNLPTVSAVGTTGQWIGELQRMLAGHLDYHIDDLDVGSWGVYTGDTRAAVSRFQSDHGMHASGTVDARTWRALQRAGC